MESSNLVLFATSAVPKRGPISSSSVNSEALFQSAERLPGTGVARFDLLVSAENVLTRWAAKRERRGFKVKPATLDAGEAAYIVVNTLTYDPAQFRYVDLLHESRHIPQLKRNAAKGVTSRNSVVRALYGKWAYQYEITLGNSQGFDASYNDCAKSRIGDYMKPGVKKTIGYNGHVPGSKVRYLELWKR